MRACSGTLLGDAAISIPPGSRRPRHNCRISIVCASSPRPGSSTIARTSSFIATLRRLPGAVPLLGAALVGLIAAMMSGAPTLLILALVYGTAIAAVAADLQAAAGRFVTKAACLGQLTYSIYMYVARHLYFLSS